MRSYIISQPARQSYQSWVYFVKGRLGAGVMACFLFIFGSQATTANSLPSLSNGQSTTMTVQDEYRFGHVIAGSIRSQLPLWNDLAALQFLKDLSQPLVSHSQLANKTVHLFLVKDGNINAFAAPGGIIGINTGLIERIGSVDELVAVLAHEVAHLSLRHYVQTRAKEKSQAPLYVGALIASIWLASNVNADIGEAGVYATHSALQRSQLSYSRTHERQADRIGFELMQQSPFDVRQMKTLLKRLQSPYVTDSTLWEWARSHPINNERVADISQRIMSSQSTIVPHGFNLTFNLMRTYQIVSLAPQPLPTIDRLMIGYDPLGADYGYILSYAKAMRHQRLGQYQQAEQLFRQLSQSRPSVQLVWYNWMQSLLAKDQHEEVFNQLGIRNERRFEDNLSLWIKALALRQDMQPAKATKVLLEILQQQPTWPVGWRTLAEWSATDQQLQLNHIAQSHWHLLRGEAEQALNQAQYASLQPTGVAANMAVGLTQKALQLLADQKEFN